MKRSQFLKTSVLSLPALACSMPRTTPLQDWMNCYSARVVSLAGGLSMEASIPPHRLAEAVHALNAITGEPMRCEGSTIRGRADGAEWLLRLVPHH